MSIIIINRSRVNHQLRVIDDPHTEIYENLTPEQKDTVELIRQKSPKDTTLEDFHTLLDICKSCS